MPGFKQIPFNDLKAMRVAITKSTAAILIEAIQGESGITIATPEYLVGLRKLCDEHNLLLLLDEVQAGHFRTGKFHSWQRILEDGDFDFLPDGISMAKALGGGFPIGAFWVREKFGGLLSAGTHASTFGGTPLACAVAERILDVVARDNLAANARRIGELLIDRLRLMQNKYPTVVARSPRFRPDDWHRIPTGPSGLRARTKTPAIQVVNRLHEKDVLTVPAATSVIRLLPPLNLSESEADEGLRPDR